MFRKNNNQLNKEITPDMIAANSDYVWLIFFGKRPDYGERMYSPFRNDRNPGCRWSWQKNQWYFIDNKGPDGKISWSVYDFVQWLNPHLDHKGVYSLICNKLNETVPNIVSIPDRRTNIKSVQQSNIVIKFEYTEWDEDDYFTREFDIPPEWMNQQPYFKVKSYWCNNRNDNAIRKNSFYNPNVIETIAYYFEGSGHTKLYWPSRPKNKMRWYSNCNADDIFGEHRLQSYTDKSYIVITKSAKDEIILNYHYGINTLATQSESITRNEKIYTLCKPFEKKFIWYDNDETGIENSEKIKQYGFYSINTNKEWGKDPAEIYRRNEEYLREITQNIKG